MNVIHILAFFTMNCVSNLALSSLPPSLPNQENLTWGYWVKSLERPEVEREVLSHFRSDIIGILNLENMPKVETEQTELESRIYLLNKPEVEKHPLVKAYKAFGLTYAEALIDAFPEVPLARWKFKPVPDGFWKVKSNQIDFLRYVALKENWKKPTDFYNLNYSLVLAYGGRPLLNTYNWTFKIVAELMDNFTWYPWEFAGAMPQGYWDDIENQKFYLKTIAELENWTTDEDYYKLNVATLSKYRGGKTLLKTKYGGSPYELLKAIRTEVKWDPKQFTRKYHGYWDNENNIRQKLLEIGRQEGWDLPLGYYNLTSTHLKRYDAARLIDNFSLQQLLETAFPEYRWYQWNFEGSSREHYWRVEKNQKDFAQYLKETFHWLSVDDCLFNFNFEVIKHFHAYRLLNKIYNKSMPYLKNDLCTKWIQWDNIESVSK